MTKTIELPGKLKELLEVEGVSAETISLVENYFNATVSGIVEEFEKKSSSKEQKKDVSLTEMARNARLIK